MDAMYLNLMFINPRPPPPVGAGAKGARSTRPSLTPAPLQKILDPRLTRTRKMGPRACQVTPPAVHAHSHVCSIISGVPQHGTMPSSNETTFVGGGWWGALHDIPVRKDNLQTWPTWYPHIMFSPPPFTCTMFMHVDWRSFRLKRDPAFAPHWRP